MVSGTRCALACGMKTIGAVFRNEADVRDAYRSLQEAGVAGDDIGIAMREDALINHVQREQVHDAHSWVGAGVAGVAGGVAGGAAGWAASLGLAAAGLSVPVIGPVLVVGALVGIGSAAGQALGWLAGGLADEGMEQGEAKFYEDSVAQGSIVMTVKADEDLAARVRTILRTHGGQDYHPG
jgi:hypothetical protein